LGIAILTMMAVGESVARGAAMANGDPLRLASSVGTIFQTSAVYSGPGFWLPLGIAIVAAGLLLAQYIRMRKMVLEPLAVASVQADDLCADLRCTGKRIRPAGNANVCRLIEALNEMSVRLQKKSDALDRRTRELMDTQDQLRCSFDAGQAGMCLIALDSTIQKVNPALCRMVSRTEEELLAMTWMDLVVVDNPKSTSRAIEHMLERIAESSAFEARCRTRDERTLWASIRCVIVRREDGAPRYVVAQLQDITPQKLLESNIGRAEQDAKDARTAKERFFAAISHDLRAPLTPALLLVSSMEGDASIPDTARDDLATVREHLENEKRIISDLLDFAAADAGKFKIESTRTSLHAAIKDAIDMCDKEITRKDLILELALDAEMDTVNGDVNRLRHAFWSLLHNATKFTPNDGMITIVTRNPRPDSIMVEVRDSGVGMDSEVLQGLFTPFAQNARTSEFETSGLGLGLTIAKAIIDAHGGAIGAKSDGAGQGSTFCVALPTLSAAQEATASGQPGAAIGSLHLLVVEDHVPTLKVLARLLAREGHVVSTAACAAEALELAGERVFDLVISDVGLPDRSGLELMQILQRQYGLRGIALTGFATDEVRLACHRAGFCEHLVKPIRIETLRMVLARVGDTPQRRNDSSDTRVVAATCDAAG